MKTTRGRPVIEPDGPLAREDVLAYASLFTSLTGRRPVRIVVPKATVDRWTWRVPPPAGAPETVCGMEIVVSDFFRLE